MQTPQYSARPSAPPMTNDIRFSRPLRVEAWVDGGAFNDPPPPYESPEPYVGLTLPRGHRSNFLPRSPVETFNLSQETAESSEQEIARRARVRLVKFKRQYLLSKFAVMKALEFIACSVAFSTCFAFRNSYGIGLLSGDRSGFFIFLHLVSWILVVILFWMSLIGYMKEISNPSQFVKMMIIHISLGFLILISSALLTDAPYTGLCSSTSTACVVFRIAVGFGYVAVVLFWVDAGLHYCAFKHSVILI